MTKKLFVICGHGAGDPGACGNGYQEAERVRALGKRIKELGGSNVILADTNRNWYADKGINNLTYASKDINIVELHMDSDDNESAKGAHIIIKEGYSADEYDKALAEGLAKIFPGRSEIIKKRSNLANANRAAAKMYNYRLAENGFISNKDDVEIFNSKLDEIAKLYLSVFGIKASGSASTSKPSTTTKPTTDSDKIDEDGFWGVETTTALQKALGTKVDGIISGQSASSKKYHVNCEETSWKYGTGGSMVIRALQEKIGVDSDGLFGPKSIAGVQKKFGLKQDSLCGPDTVKAIQKWINGGCK